ncbi:MAG TPA: M20 family metallopeptidase [Opitutaceae bacterium]|nr:M20 family metallopeptidase [Opitutaceae bacterium]
MAARNKAKAALAGTVADLAAPWQEIALRIHANPEIGLKEQKASAWLADELTANGFAVQRRVAGMETAFVASAGRKSGRPCLAFLAEYDALPGLGHACSHNLIGTAACLAGVALARVLPKAAAAIKVIGCPAEEFYGGKVQLLQRGAFRGVDAALMAHGYFLTLGARPTIGRASLIFEFFGRAAHASTVPAQGINALDALIQTFTSIGLLRQQTRSEARIHGIITHGGTAANIIPDYARGEFYVRSASTKYLGELKRRVTACAKAAALATGARLKISSEGHEFRPIRANQVLAQSYEDNMRCLGQKVDRLPLGEGTGSTDFGNVSHAVPALHGYFRIVNHEVRPHTPGFAAACRTDAALRGLVHAAQAMALTAYDLIQQPRLLDAARAEWQRRGNEEQ